MLKHALRFTLLLLVIAGLGLWWLMQPQVARLSTAELSGRVPVLSAPDPQTIPTIAIADAVGWPADGAPRAAPGLTVTRFATGLSHPRSLLTLPNGDVLVAESNRPPSENSGITAWIERQVLGRAGAMVPSANRITLLRDADGDGVAEVKTPFLTGLNSPSGMALVGNTLYVANTDALMAFDYVPGETRIATPGRKIIDIPANAPNSHWARTLAAGPDGILYVGVGSNSNIADGGIAAERGRALVLEVRPASNNYKRTYASGLRNPSGLAINPATGDLWATVNERDMLGSDMVPDYMTRVNFADFYGWPWYYWGGFVDDRVTEADAEDRRQYVRRPDYALGAHTAPLGLSFATSEALGAPWTRGVFVALHGSWNRSPAAGYSVVFVPFEADGRRPAAALPINVLTGFLNAEGQAQGRPADVRQARDGALLVADDVGNIIWRVTRRGGTAEAAPTPATPR